MVLISMMMQSSLSLHNVVLTNKELPSILNDVGALEEEAALGCKLWPALKRFAWIAAIATVPSRTAL